MFNVMIYGTGRNGNLACHYLPSEANLIGFLETRPSANTFLGHRIFGLDDIQDMEYDMIYVANTHIETVLALLDNGVPKNKIAVCNGRLYSDYLAYNHGTPDIRCTFPVVLSRFLSDTGGGMDLQLLQMHKNAASWHEDYCRYRTLRLLAEEIRTRKIDGDIAELGVSRGTFAAKLNYEFPERRLFLFDTFEGFDVNDLKREREQEFYEEGIIGAHDFEDTSVKLVLDKMENPSVCVVRKGRFPDTIPEEDCAYALVSMDCDLYAPTLAGLEYFVPRLSPGGYIMLHDYNGDDFGEGTHRAVENYEQKYGHIAKVPLPDACGTLVIAR